MSLKEEAEKKRGARPALGAVALILLLAIPGCRFGIPDYTLTIIVEEGVTGTPEAGQYVHTELTSIDFVYTPVNPVHTIEVWVNDSLRNAGTGTIVLYGDGYELKAKLLDVRDTWKFKLNYADEAIPDPGEFTITFEGSSLTAGTFSDSRGLGGTWKAEYNLLTLTYADWFDYTVVGNLFSMQGSFSGEELTGTWTASRQK